MSSLDPVKNYIGVKALIVQDGKLLLLKKETKQWGDYWEAPGGRRNLSESFEETLKRELSEELPGITNMKLGELIAAYPTTKPFDDHTDLVLLFFSVTATLPSPLHLSNEHCQYYWASKQDLKTLKGLNPYYQELTQELL